MKKESYALIVGASTTVGAEFARQLAERGFSLVLVARRQNLLDDLATEIRAVSQVDVQTRATDLFEEAAVGQLIESTRSLCVEFLVCNANLHRVGLFEELDLEIKLRMLRMNSELPVRLAHAYGPGMVKRGRGNIVFVNALNCLTALDIDSVFQGTKSFLLVFGESLWAEYRRHGVGVGVAMVSGIEGSESYEKKLSDVKRQIVRWAGASMRPQRIVREALEQLDLGECVLIPDGSLPINRANFQMGLAVRSARSPTLTRAFAGFYRWLLDGDEVEQAQSTGKVFEIPNPASEARRAS
jgi:short-subunit dehydrogenase